MLLATLRNLLFGPRCSCLSRSGTRAGRPRTATPARVQLEPLEDRAHDTARRNPKYAAEIVRAIPHAKAIEREVFADVSFAPDDLPEKVR